jgi:hypothetical protein
VTTSASRSTSSSYSTVRKVYTNQQCLLLTRSRDFSPQKNV